MALKLRHLLPKLMPLLILLTSFAAAEPLDHAEWNRLLQQHVSATDNPAVTVVDYAGLQQQSAALDHYLDQLAQIERGTFDQWPEDTQLAFLINAYNAWTVKLILSRYPKLDSIKELGSLLRSPWQQEFITLFGSTRTLDDIEHTLIRGAGRYNDPRIHFAVNCASVGCPALRAEAYTGEQLDRQLEEQTRLFLADRARNRLRGSALQLSPLFKWYREDFERGGQGYESLYKFFTTYKSSLGLDDMTIRRLQSGEIDLEYTEYDWRLNTSRDSAAAGRD